MLSDQATAQQAATPTEITSGVPGGETYGSVEELESKLPPLTVLDGAVVPRDGDPSVKYTVDETSKAPLVPPVVTMSGMAPKPARAIDAVIRKFRVVGLSAPKTYVERAGLGKTCTMRPNKVLDERHYDIPFIRSQGFELVEVVEDRKMGVLR